MLTSLQLTVLIISWGLVVLTWIIQLVHYPSFHFIDSKKFLNFHTHHTKSIMTIVMPLMFAELTITFLLGYQNGFTFLNAMALAIIVGVWVNTFFVQIPLHNQLSTGYDPQIVKKLVRTNWIPTSLWSIKAVMLTWTYCDFY